MRGGAAYSEDVIARFSFAPLAQAAPSPSSQRPPVLPAPAPSPAPRLRPWSRIWRYLAAVGVGVIVWLFVAADYLEQDSGNIPPDTLAAIGGVVVLDLVLGVVAVCVLPMRRRRPMLTAVATSCLSAASAFSVGPTALAIVSMSTRRRWKPVVAVGLVWVASTMFYELVLRPSVPGAASSLAVSWVSGGLALAIYAVCVTTGFYIGARRELLASLRERAETAEREQALREESARESERTRIAREMHDVLAHHISLVSLHAGALDYRTDLTRQETADAAAIIQSNAQLALTELRQILGVLRSPRDGEGHGNATADPPQPTLRELPALLADSREAGMQVELDAPNGPPALDDLSQSVSRDAYRIIQEALTNARKHAAGAPVTVTLQKRDGQLLIRVQNPRRPASVPPSSGSGMGLTGLQERAELAGGNLAHGTDADDGFVVTAALPWR